MISDVMERITPIRMLFHKLRSLVDSFTFEIRGSTIVNDSLATDLTVKRFKSQLFYQVKEIDKELENYESEIENLEVFKRLKSDEEKIEGLQKSIKGINEKNSNLFIENGNLQKELDLSKCHLNSTEDSTNLKELEISNLQEKLNGLANSAQEEKFKLERNLLQQIDENNFLKEALKFKEKEIKTLNKDKIQLNLNYNKIDKDHLVSSALLRQCETEIKEYKLEIEKYKTLEKIDKRNLGNVKNHLAENKEELKKHENQLRIDYELISTLKNEIVNLHYQIKEMASQKENLSSETKSLKTVNSQYCAEIEEVKAISKQLEGKMSELTGRNIKFKEKKRAFVSENNEIKKELNDVKSQLEEKKVKLTVFEKESSHYKCKFDSINKSLLECQSKIKILNTMKSVSEEKIKLLHQFIDDFRITELQFQTKIMSENNTNRSRLDIMRNAFEKLF